MTRSFGRRAGVVAACWTLSALALGAQGRPAASPRPVDAWRQQHERQIVDELLQLVAIPNVAGDTANIPRNADRLVALFAQRGFTVEKTEGSGSPVVFATLDAPAARGIVTFYIHYDGQPVSASEWTHCQPFVPCLDAWAARSPSPSLSTFDPDWRIYGRSASDDKAPIVALLNAVDAVRATGAGPTWSLRVVVDGEEEAGSGNFRKCAAARGDALKGDVAIMLDGPRHPSGPPTMYFGVRGGAGLTLTVYGARHDLHFGNYGNWAPDPPMRLAKLLATMKDDPGRVTIAQHGPDENLRLGNLGGHRDAGVDHDDEQAVTGQVEGCRVQSAGCKVQGDE